MSPSMLMSRDILLRKITNGNCPESRNKMIVQTKTKAIAELHRYTPRSTEDTRFFELAAPIRKRVRTTAPSSKPARTIAGSIARAIEEATGRRISSFQIRVELESVTVVGQAPTYFVRQVAEHKARSIIVEHLKKQFISEIVVNPPA